MTATLVSPVRQRLTPQQRIPQILEAALIEFSARGYTPTRIDDIAARAGLSKGGVYAHFRSKDDIFVALLNWRLSTPFIDVQALLDRAVDTHELVNTLLDLLYARLGEPGTVAMVRLLIAEAVRIPELADRWHAQTVEALHVQLRHLLERAAERGLCRPSILSEQPWLLLAPLISHVMQRLTLQRSDLETASARQAHAQLLLELLSPRG